MELAICRKTSLAAGLLAMAMAMVLLAGPASGRRFDRCGLTRELRGQVPAEQLSTWVCIAEHESSLDTTLINGNNVDGSWDHGLFQLNDRYWVGRDARGGGCGLAGAEVRDDDIRNDVRCVLQIHAEHQRLSGNGFNAWAAFSRLGHCRSNVHQYTQGC